MSDEGMKAYMDAMGKGQCIMRINKVGPGYGVEMLVDRSAEVKELVKIEATMIEALRMVHHLVLQKGGMTRKTLGGVIHESMKQETQDDHEDDELDEGEDENV